MSSTICVFGATGNQGSSVIRHILGDPKLSQSYRIRAVTRNKANAVKKFPENVDVVVADLDDKSSLFSAMSGAHTVFALTTTNYAGSHGHDEIEQGKNLVDVAIKSKVQMFIWSTLPSPKRLSNGKYPNVATFEAKAEVENYIRSQQLRSAFFSPGSFMQNFATFSRPQPDPENPGCFAIFGVISPTKCLPLIDIAADTGKFVAAILASPDAFEGKTLCGASWLYTMEDQAKLVGASIGKAVSYKQVPSEKFKAFLPPNNAQELLEMNLYQEEFGYYGAETATLVERSVMAARTNLVDLPSFLASNPVGLE